MLHYDCPPAGGVITLCCTRMWQVLSQNKKGPASQKPTIVWTKILITDYWRGSCYFINAYTLNNYIHVVHSFTYKLSVFEVRGRTGFNSPLFKWENCSLLIFFPGIWNWSFKKNKTQILRFYKLQSCWIVKHPLAGECCAILSINILHAWKSLKIYHGTEPCCGLLFNQLTVALREKKRFPL